MPWFLSRFLYFSLYDKFRQHFHFFVWYSVEKKSDFMKYIFLEKTGNKEDPFYTEYLYFITDNKDFDYSKLSDSEKS